MNMKLVPSRMKSDSVSLEIAKRLYKYPVTYFRFNENSYTWKHPKDPEFLSKAENYPFIGVAPVSDGLLIRIYHRIEDNYYQNFYPHRDLEDNTTLIKDMVRRGFTYTVGADPVNKNKVGIIFERHNYDAKSDAYHEAVGRVTGCWTLQNIANAALKALLMEEENC